MGIVLYMLLTGKSPFKGKKFEALIEENKKAKINYDGLQFLDISPESKSMLKKMLDPNPSLRISSSEVLDSNWISTLISKDDLGNSKNLAESGIGENNNEFKVK